MSTEPSDSLLERLGQLADRSQGDGAPLDSPSFVEALAKLAKALQAAPPAPESDADDPSSADGEDGKESFLDRFEIGREIGSGGFAVVVEARDLVTGRDVAIKFPKPEALLDRQQAGRFRRESRALAALDHPNIVPVLESGQVGPLPYIVSAFCPGPDLAAWRKTTSQPIAPRLAAEIVRQLADAVEHAHGRGILHRDIKPSNVLLFPKDATNDAFAYLPKLTDFGLARAIDRQGEGSESGMRIGTAAYMSPEQAAGKGGEVSTQSDIYSLGVVLFELLTGQVPFVPSSASSLLRLIAEEPAPPARRFRADVPADLDAICGRCLEASPAQRYLSAAELRDDLGRFLAGEPVRARPIGRVARLARWCRRKPVIAGLSVALLVAATLAMGGTVWQGRLRLFHERSAMHHAEIARAENERAEQSALQAQGALLDLAWIQRDQIVAGQDSDNLNVAVLQHIEQYEQLMTRHPNGILTTPSRAAALSVKATAAAHAGEFDRAKEHFEQSLALWRDVLREHPTNALYRRSMVLTLIGYHAHLARAAKGIENEGVRDDELEALLDGDGADPSLHEDYACFLLDSAFQLANRGKREQAINAYERALAAFERLSERDPQSVPYVFRRGQTERFLALQWKRSAQPARAESMHQAACRHLEEAVSRDPANPVYRFHLGEAYHKLGVFYRERKDAAAFALVERAVGVLEPLCREPFGASRPSYRDCKLSLAASLGELGVCASQKGDDLAGNAFLSQSVDHWRELDLCDPLSGEELKRYAQTVYRRALLLQAARNEAEANADFATAKDLFTRLQADSTLAPADALSLANCLIATGDMAKSRGNIAAARSDYQEALELLDKIHAKNVKRAALIRDRRAALRQRLESLPNGQAESVK